MNLQYTTMDSTVHVSNVTALVIPMEVTVEKAAQWCQQSSDSMVEADCVDLLTRQIAQHTRHAAEPTTTPAPARDDTAKTQSSTHDYQSCAIN